MGKEESAAFSENFILPTDGENPDRRPLGFKEDLQAGSGISRPQKLRVMYLAEPGCCFSSPARVSWHGLYHVS
jgi:hypothetical protein